MTALTDYVEGIVRDWLSQGSDAPTAPGTIYLGLHTADPTDSPDGSTEVNSDGNASDYSRADVTAGSGFDTPNENDFENASEVSWGEATNDWGTCTHVVAWDDTLANGGNPLIVLPMDSSKTISTGDEAKINAGNLNFSID